MTIDRISSKVCSHSEVVNTVIQAALEAVDPYKCTHRFMKLDKNHLFIGNEKYDIRQVDNIYITGIGKAVLPMALAVQDLLGDRLRAGLLIAKHADRQIIDQLSPVIEIYTGSHPIPTQESIISAQKMADFTERMTEKDLVICLISGGGSALMTMPVKGITLEDMQEVTRALLFSGATIHEVNAVRKHLDQLKGGGLARKIWPARLTTLVLSDVIGDSLDAIASGPTVPDSSTFQDIIKVLERYQLKKSLPQQVLEHLEKGTSGEIPETVKPEDECMQTSHTYIIGSLSVAVEAACQQAHLSGLNAAILSTELTGEAREVGKMLAEELGQYVQASAKIKKPGVLIAGGETTVTVTGKGKGGRNQETALSAALHMGGLPDCLFISLATDGEDGPTDAAGAVVDGTTIQKGQALQMDARDYLDRNDAYSYLEKVDALIKIGPTGTNVNDIVFLFAF